MEYKNKLEHWAKNFQIIGYDWVRKSIDITYLWEDIDELRENITKIFKEQGMERFIEDYLDQLLLTKWPVWVVWDKLFCRKFWKPCTVELYDWDCNMVLWQYTFDILPS